MIKIDKNISLKPFNTFGIDVSAAFFTKVTHVDQFAELTEWIESHKLPFILIGGGSNILFTKDYNGLAVIIETQGKQLVDEDEQYDFIEAQAGENWHSFVRWTIAEGYMGLENLSLIPGTVGAAPMQNIGAYGIELADRFHSLKAIEIATGKQKTFDKAACDFAYRHSYFKTNLDKYLIESVIFKLPKTPEWKINYAGVKDQLGDKELSARLISDTIIQIRQSKLPSPETIGNAGSFFKNPIISEAKINQLKEEFPDIPAYAQADGLFKTSAAWMIDQCGWKGRNLGKAGVYPQHALVLTNLSNASGHDVWRLAEHIIQSVNERFTITLEPEPRVL